MHLGVCYYPEHWPESMWTDDAARMKALGIERVRIAEFAWSRIEPAPGERSRHLGGSVVELRPRNRRFAAAGGGEDDGGYLGGLLGYLMEPRPEGEFSFHAGSSSSGTGVRGMASRF